MYQMEFFISGSLEKVFPSCRPKELRTRSFTALRGDTISLQLVYHLSHADAQSRRRYYDIRVESGLTEALLRTVELVPAEYLGTENRDRFYLSTEPGLYPDLLRPSTGRIRPLADQYRSLWISLPVPSSAKEGIYPVRISAQEVLIDPDTGISAAEVPICWECTLSVAVAAMELPPLELFHTQWFHADCLCDYYRTAPWSQRHWEVVEQFISFAARECAINMLLTPVFTPPLDTDVGAQRRTIQLVGISKKGDTYEFDFSQLRRWYRICTEAGITSVEFSHLFTQWGAKKTPKIIVHEDGIDRQLFGWHVDATDPSYRSFLEAFLPALIRETEQAGFDRDHMFFHISDEPDTRSMADYRAAKEQVADLLEGCLIMDALSSHEFYTSGLVSLPVPATDHIEPFRDTVSPLWTYYCIAQGNLAPNRFIGLPSARNRIMGVLLYLYDVAGFLHWGYNYYHDENSRHAVNPFESTDGNRAFPAGDPFLVYPGPEGVPFSSVRNEVQKEAFYDLRYLRLLEAKIGREAVTKVIREQEDAAFSFTDYPRDDEYLPRLRTRVLQELGVSYP